MELGGTLRRLRQERRLSGAELARRVQVSPSFISQVERGLTSPSVDVLWAMARALEVPIGAFFGDGDGAGGAPPPPRARVVRRDQRKVLRFPGSPAYELLSPDLKGRLEVVWAEFAPGTVSPQEPYVHEGEECLVVISGEMTYWVDGQEYVLGPGDSLYLQGNAPHRAMNRGSERAVIVCAISPPSF